MPAATTVSPTRSSAPRPMTGDAARSASASPGTVNDTTVAPPAARLRDSLSASATTAPEMPAPSSTSATSQSSSAAWSSIASLARTSRTTPGARASPVAFSISTEMATGAVSEMVVAIVGETRTRSPPSSSSTACMDPARDMPPAASDEERAPAAPSTDGSPAAGSTPAFAARGAAATPPISAPTTPAMIQRVRRAGRRVEESARRRAGFDSATMQAILRRGVRASARRPQQAPRRQPARPTRARARLT